MTPKRPRDPRPAPAKSIIDIATGQKPDRDPTIPDHRCRPYLKAICPNLDLRVFLVR